MHRIQVWVNKSLDKSSLGLVNLDTETLMNDTSVNNGILKDRNIS